MPNNSNNFFLLKIFFNRTNLTSNITRNYKANNYENAKCENGVRLIGGLYATFTLFRKIFVNSYSKFLTSSKFSGISIDLIWASAFKETFLSLKSFVNICLALFSVGGFNFSAFSNSITCFKISSGRSFLHLTNNSINWFVKNWSIWIFLLVVCANFPITRQILSLSSGLSFSANSYSSIFLSDKIIGSRESLVII